MGVESDFLDRLLEFGLSYGIDDESYFKIYPIHDIDKSCCTGATSRVIDFDRTKDIVAQRGQLQTPKSCDALQINSTKTKIDFIEFKGWKEFIDRQSRSTGLKEDTIQTQIDKFDLKRKITDSLFILQHVILDRRFVLTNIERTIFENVPKFFLIVVDINLIENSVEKIAITLEALTTTSDPTTQIQILIEKEVDGLTQEIPISIQDVKLVSCENIDKYLNQS